MRFARPDMVVEEAVIESTVTLTITGQRTRIVAARAVVEGKSVDDFLLAVFADAVEALRAPKTMRRPAPTVVPSWVPEPLRQGYADRASATTEQDAAAWARREKKRRRL